MQFSHIKKHSHGIVNEKKCYWKFPDKKSNKKKEEMTNKSHKLCIKIHK